MPQMRSTATLPVSCGAPWRRRRRRVTSGVQLMSSVPHTAPAPAPAPAPARAPATATVTATATAPWDPGPRPLASGSTPPSMSAVHRHAGPPCPCPHRGANGYRPTGTLWPALPVPRPQGRAGGGRRRAVVAAGASPRKGRPSAGATSPHCMRARPGNPRGAALCHWTRDWSAKRMHVPVLPRCPPTVGAGPLGLTSHVSWWQQPIAECGGHPTPPAAGEVEGNRGGGGGAC